MNSDNKGPNLGGPLPDDIAEAGGEIFKRAAIEYAERRAADMVSAMRSFAGNANASGTMAAIGETLEEFSRLIEGLPPKVKEETQSILKAGEEIIRRGGIPSDDPSLTKRAAALAVNPDFVKILETIMHRVPVSPEPATPGNTPGHIAKPARSP